MQNHDKTSYLMHTGDRPSAVMLRGEGSYLWDDSGKRYLDFIQGWAVNTLGHASPELVHAVKTQSELLFTPSPAFHNAPQLDLAEMLCRLTGMKAVFFANSGAEANEGAVKLARKWGRLHKQGAYEIITTHDAFHGRTLAMMAASGKAGWDQLFPPNMPGFIKVPYNDVAAMKSAITAHTVALMVEPIQGEAGVVVPEAGYLTALRKLADAHGLLLILDEVQTGVGRTGPFLAQDAELVRADIVTLGKGLGGGVPVSALLANERCNVFVPGDQGGTYSGNPLVAAVALAVLEVVTAPGFREQLEQSAQSLRTGLTLVAQSISGTASVRGRGLLQAIVFEENVAPALQRTAFELGLLLNAPRPNILRFMPRLNVTASEIEEMTALLAKAAASLN